LKKAACEPLIEPGDHHTYRVIRLSVPLLPALFLREKEREKDKMRDMMPVLGPTDFSSLTPARRMTLSGAFLRGERGSHPRAGFNRRRRYASDVIEHQPKLRIQVATLPGLGDLHQPT